MKKYKNVGGQAVIEGVMMRGKESMATAVRLDNGEIVVDKQNKVPLNKKYKILGLPFVRGVVSFFDSLITGIKILNYSASFFDVDNEEEQEESKFDKWFKDTFKEKTSSVIVGISLVLSLGLSFLLFFALPTFITGLLKNIITKRYILNILEGLMRILILIVYMFLVSKMEDIKRVFQYHGAEHKTIFCYEEDEELTVENVKRFSRFHPRCGTNFVFLVMVISILVFSLVSWDSFWERILFRLLLLPVVLGISYEVIKWMGKSESFLSNFFAYPGLLLQRITTKEPYDDQIEVAIVALKEAEGIATKDIINISEETNNKETKHESNKVEITDEVENIRTSEIVDIKSI